MKKLSLLVAAFSLMLGTLACAETSEAQQPASQSPASQATAPAHPQLSDNPKMKAEGKRLAALMEKLQKESDPDERRKIMSEAMCPQ